MIEMRRVADAEGRLRPESPGKMARAGAGVEQADPGERRWRNLPCWHRGIHEIEQEGDEEVNRPRGQRGHRGFVALPFLDAESPARAQGTSSRATVATIPTRISRAGRGEVAAASSGKAGCVSFLKTSEAACIRDGFRS